MGRVTDWRDRLRPGDSVIVDAGDAGVVRATVMRWDQGWLVVRLGNRAVLRCARSTVALEVEGSPR